MLLQRAVDVIALGRCLSAGNAARRQGRVGGKLDDLVRQIRRIKALEQEPVGAVPDQVRRPAGA